MVVAVRVLGVRRRTLEHLLPPSQTAPTEGHVGDTEPKGEADSQREDELFWKELMSYN